MLFYITRRLVFGVVLALLVTLITFAVLSVSFDNIALKLAGSGASPETVAAMTTKLGFDRPLLVQYVDWLTHTISGDFGRSLFTAEPVGPAILQRLSVTMSLVLVGLTVTTVVGFLLGVLAATWGGAVDRVIQILILLGFIFPALIVAIGLVWVLAITLHWLPATGYTPITDDPAAWARSIAIPVAVLAIGGSANLTSQVRGAMIDELRKDYVRTLRTRGISPLSYTLKHALRNASGPALTVLSLEFIGMLGGALIIERVFALPGFGTFAYNASTAGDVPVILGVTTYSVLLVIVVNLATDLLNGWLNPKARIA